MNELLKQVAGKRVLITGGLGFIGSNLAKQCVDLGARVTIYDCLEPHSGGALHNIDDFGDEVTVLFSDIRDHDPLANHVTGQDVVFNCAASTSHPVSMREPWLDQDVNSRGVINLLEALRRFNPTARFVHVGTSTQLGPLRYSPADELHPEFPTDIYSANKSVSEKYVLVYAKAYGIFATVVRLSNTYGPRASIHSADFTFNNYFVGLALQDLPIRVFGDGSQLRNVIYVDDAVEAMIVAALSDEAVGETFFAVGDEHYSVAEIAERTVRTMGRGRVEFSPWPAGRKRIDVGDAVISNEKIKSRLGWSPSTDFSRGLEMTKEFFVPRMSKYLR